VMVVLLVISSIQVVQQNDMFLCERKRQVECHKCHRKNQLERYCTVGWNKKS
jgi:hypothetical protein